MIGVSNVSMNRIHNDKRPPRIQQCTNSLLTTQQLQTFKKQCNSQLIQGDGFLRSLIHSFIHPEHDF